MPRRQHSAPHIVSAGKASSLERVPFGDPTFPESRYQELLFTHPSLIPVDDIEQTFAPLIPLARELPIGRGAVDIAYINSEGFITLVETKLWRNPEARRDVVAQIIEYAAGMAKWTYADLCNKVLRVRSRQSGDPAEARGTGQGEDPILPLVRDEPEFDEVRFIDSVTANLRQGRFLLLIVGDGIREGVEELARTMQESPHLGFTLALVETAVYRMASNPDDVLILPRVLAQTREVVRYVIEIRNTIPGAIVAVSQPEATDQIPTARGITETAFYEQLEKNAGKPVVDFARWFVAEAKASPQLHLSWGPKGPALWWTDEQTDTQAGLLRLRASGELSMTNALPSYCSRYGVATTIADSFQDGLVKLLGDAKRVERGTEGYTHLATTGGGPPSFAPLAAQREAFWKLITDTTEALRRAQAERANRPKD